MGRRQRCHVEAVTTIFKYGRNVWNHQSKDVPLRLGRAGMFNVVADDLGAKRNGCVCAYARCLTSCLTSVDV